MLDVSLFYGLVNLVIYVALPHVAHVPLPVMAIDSLSYVSYSPYRDPAYPMTLRVVAGLGLGLAAVPVLQIAVFSAALGMLYRSAAVAIRSKWLALALVLVVGFNPYVMSRHLQIMTESLFMTSTVVLLGAAIDFLSRPRTAPLAVASTAVGAAILIRAAGWSLVPLLPLLPLLVSRQLPPCFGKLLFAAALPCFTLVVAGSVFSGWWFGVDRTSQLPRNLFEKTMLFSAGPSIYPPGSPEGRLWTIAEQQGRPVRVLLSATPSRAARAYLDSQYQGFLMTRYEQARIIPWMMTTGRFANVAEVEQTMQKVALDRVKRQPAAFLGGVVSDVVFLWTAPNGAAAYRSLAGTAVMAQPLPLSEGFADFFPLQRPGRVKLFVADMVGWASVLAGIMSLAIVAKAGLTLARGVDLDQSLAVAAWSALGVHGNFLLMGLVAQPLSRYAFTMWPILATSLLFAAIYAMSSPSNEAYRAYGGDQHADRQGCRVDDLSEFEHDERETLSAPDGGPADGQVRQS